MGKLFNPEMDSHHSIALWVVMERLKPFHDSIHFWNRAVSIYLRYEQNPIKSSIFEQNLDYYSLFLLLLGGFHWRIGNILSINHHGSLNPFAYSKQSFGKSFPSLPSTSTIGPPICTGIWFGEYFKENWCHQDFFNLISSILSVCSLLVSIFFSLCNHSTKNMYVRSIWNKIESKDLVQIS